MMVTDTVRTHVVLPRSLVDEVDRLTGSRRRSEYISEAIREKLARDRLSEAFDDVVGLLAGVDIPGWETSESTVEWVRTLRHNADRGLDATLGPSRANGAIPA